MINIILFQGTSSELFQISSILNFVNFHLRNFQWVEVEPRGRSMQDEYIFSASGSPEALASFKQNLNNKLNAIRYLEMPLPDYVPIETNLLEIVKAANKQPSTVCFVENRVVKCWNLDKDLQADIRRDFQAEVDRWSVEFEENWVESDIMVRYIRNYLKYKKIHGQVSSYVFTYYVVFIKQTFLFFISASMLKFVVSRTF